MAAVKTFTGLKIAVTHGKFLEQKVREEGQYDSEGHLNKTEDTMDNTHWVHPPAGGEKEEQEKKRSF